MPLAQGWALSEEAQQHKLNVGSVLPAVTALSHSYRTSRGSRRAHKQ